jgi:hypothetical protein
LEWVRNDNHSIQAKASIYLVKPYLNDDIVEPGSQTPDWGNSCVNIYIDMQSSEKCQPTRTHTTTGGGGKKRGGPFDALWGDRSMLLIGHKLHFFYAENKSRIYYRVFKDILYLCPPNSRSSVNNNPLVDLDTVYDELGENIEIKVGFAGEICSDDIPLFLISDDDDKGCGCS